MIPEGKIKDQLHLLIFYLGICGKTPQILPIQYHSILI